jgi:spore coat protein U-like protein
VNLLHKILLPGSLAMALLTNCGAAEAALRCSLGTGVALNFGTYDDSSLTTRDVSTTFSVSCCRTGGPNPTVGTLAIAMGASANSSQINTRQMKNSLNGDLLSYQLYFTSFGGTVWGDGVSGGSVFTQTVSVSRSCNAQNTIPVGSAIFGRIFVLQPVSITITP